MKLLAPVLDQLKNPESSQNLTNTGKKMVTATVITCCLARLNVLPKAEYSMALLQQFILEPDVKKRVCVHYEWIDSLLATQQSR